MNKIIIVVAMLLLACNTHKVQPIEDQGLQLHNEGFPKILHNIYTHKWAIMMFKPTFDNWLVGLSESKDTIMNAEPGKEIQFPDSLSCVSFVAYHRSLADKENRERKIKDSIFKLEHTYYE